MQATKDKDRRQSKHVKDGCISLAARCLGEAGLELELEHEEIEEGQGQQTDQVKPGKAPANVPESNASEQKKPGIGMFSPFN